VNFVFEALNLGVKETDFLSTFHQIGHGDITSVCGLRAGWQPPTACFCRAGFKIETLHRSVAGFPGFAGFFQRADVLSGVRLVQV